MKFLALIIIALAILTSSSHPAFSVEPGYETVVKTAIKVIGSGDRRAIADLVKYPLSREVPLPIVNNKDEFIKAFDEVFDESLLKAISTSNANSDWSEMGWRGIMFKDGELWLDYDGTIIAVNHETEKGKRKRARLLGIDRKNLHKSLQQFIEPVIEWTTKDYRIRIDRITENKFRYAAWPVSKKTSEKPDLVLNDGDVIFDGSGGNHHFDFKSGIFMYRCYVNLIGTSDTPLGELEVYKQNKLILSQPVVKVLKE